jgi:hypothetical protein
MVDLCAPCVCVYSPESFKTVRQYGLPMQVTLDKDLDAYLASMGAQMEQWLADGAMQKVWDGGSVCVCVCVCVLMIG